MVSRRVIVVGGGLAGLSCTAELAAAGVDVRLLERDDRVGGRVRTDEVDGFRLDRGFQVLLTAYPEARRLLDYRALDLRPFFPGALVRTGGAFRRLADPWRRPLAGLGSLAGGAVSLLDALRIARLRWRVGRQYGRDGIVSGERTTRDRLHDEGFSERVVEEFLRPFFAGVFLDPELATSERQLEFVFAMFAAGPAVVPARGMEAIPGQLVSRLPNGTVTTGVTVERVRAGAVTTAGGDTLEADAVVVAADGAAAAELLPTVQAPRWRSATCLYFAADHPPLRGPYLVLSGAADGPVNNLCVMSEVAPRCAPAGRALVSATVLGAPGAGDGELEGAVRQQLETWFGAEVAGWRLLRVYRIPRALPAQEPPRPPLRPARVEAGLYLCGDHAADSSINGAMASGRRAARAVLDDLETPGP